MLEKKYIIIITIVICLFILYYFYDEIASAKKMFMPTYQKTMALEARIINLEKKANKTTDNGKKKPKKLDSPALSITYQSDMAKNGNLSAKYTDLSETEARELLKNIENKSNNKIKNDNKLQTNFITGGIPHGEISEPKNIILKNEMPINNNAKLDFDEDSETINVRIDALIKKNQNNESDSLETEYQKIYDSLNITNIRSEDVFNDELDEDIIRSISESIQYADMPSENTILDIPETPKLKQQKNIIKRQTKKKISAKQNR